MVDGGWWMVDGGWVEKKFFNFSQNLHIDSTPKDNFLIFGVKRKNFLMGLKTDFKVEILRFSLQFVTENRPFYSKKNLAENWPR